MALSKWCAAAVAAAAILSIAAPADAQSRPERPFVEIRRVDAPPRLEDFVSGEVAGGDPVRGFLQRSPGDLTPATDATEAFLSYDAENLYAVFVCRTANRALLRAHMARREAIFNDDTVALYLDTFDDRQRAYMFVSSPLGIQADGITTEGQGDDFSFDTVWHSRGVVTEFGYVVWMAVPFKSLRFPSASGPRSWGIALGRQMPAKNEQVFWPGITDRIAGFTSQFAEARGVSAVSGGRNIQVIPYGTFTGARFLDVPVAAFGSEAEGRAGADAKIVLRDGLTLDFTANPDFSQVESDEPQVTVNQRFEVFFPEKRPFFLENAGLFQTSDSLFFSRRLRDPQLGARLSGKAGNWAVGALVMDDRAPGRQLPASDGRFGDRSTNAVLRAKREFGDSSIGAMVTSRDFGSEANRAAALDARVRLNAQWFFDGQASLAGTSAPGTPDLRDAAYTAALSRAGRGFTYQWNYSDVGRDFRAPLGFIPRTDIRQVTSFASYRWRPSDRALQSFGPNSFLQATWDHAGVLQDWLVRFPFQVDFVRQTGVFARHSRSMERFAGIRFDEYENLVNVYTSLVGWMDFSMLSFSGTRPNYYPSNGQVPELAKFRDLTASVTLRPTSRLRLDETYLYSRLKEDRTNRAIFDNHIIRTKMNYQFTRELSLRAIVDYSAILSNPALVALERTKHLTADLLLTLLVSPGTALYIGYTDGFDNVALDPVTGLRATRSPTTSTGRQVFVKTSYLFRF